MENIWNTMHSLCAAAAHPSTTQLLPMPSNEHLQTLASNPTEEILAMLRLFEQHLLQTTPCTSYHTMVRKLRTVFRLQETAGAWTLRFGASPLLCSYWGIRNSSTRTWTSQTMKSMQTQHSQPLLKHGTA